MNLIATCQATSMNSTKQIELRKILRGFLTQNTNLQTKGSHLRIFAARDPCGALSLHGMYDIKGFQQLSFMIVYIPHSMLERLCWIDSRWAGIPVKWAKVHGYQCGITHGI